MSESYKVCPKCGAELIESFFAYRGGPKANVLRCRNTLERDPETKKLKCDYVDYSELKRIYGDNFSEESWESE